MLRRATPRTLPRALVAPARRPLASVVSTQRFRPGADEEAERAARAARRREEERRREEKRRRRAARPGVLKRLLRAGVLSAAAAAAYAAYLSENVARPEEGLTWQRLFVETLPTRAASRAWGAVNELTLPVVLRAPLYRLWGWKYGSDMLEAELPLEEYANLQQFFTRKLKPGARVPQSGDLVSAADSHLLVCGEVAEGGLVEQVKGVTYDAATLVGHEVRPSRAGKMFYAVLYLGPGDYHRFHSPADMVVRETLHVAGEMMPVAPALVAVVPGLFSLNERVVVSGEWKHGAMDVVPVAATNVGNIAIAFDPELQTNVRAQDAAVRARKAVKFRDVLPASGREAAERVLEAARAASDAVRYWAAVAFGRHGGDADSGAAGGGAPSHLTRRAYGPGGVRLAAGDELGTFQLGSTVVLLFEAPESFRFRVDPGTDVKVGQTLGTVGDAAAK